MKQIQTFRLHPTDRQAAVIRQRFALAGYAYNWGLQETERVWEVEKRHLSYFDIVEIYRHYVNYDLRRVFSREEHEALCHLDFAYSEYFEHRCDKPRHKEPEDMVSCTVRAENLKFDYKRGTVRLPYAGCVRCNLYRQVQGHPTTATIKEVRQGEFRLVLLSDIAEQQPSERTPEVVGIDLGLKTFATLSDGTKIDFPEHIWGSRATRHEQHLQRKQSRCQKGSKRWQKAKDKLARFHEHRVNQRKDFHYQTAAMLTKKYKAVAVEDLYVEDMMTAQRSGRRQRNRNFSHYGLKQFLNRLKIRCLRTGTQFLQIGRYEPSSKQCHVCGYVRPSLSVNTREWTCPKCHTHHDRDVNAAINIKTLGQRIQQTLPDVGGEVLTVEQTNRPCCEPVKADRDQSTAVMPQRKPRPAHFSQEEQEHNISRLAVKDVEQRELNAFEFLNIIQDIIAPSKKSEITGLSVVQLSGIRYYGLSLEWRRQVLFEKCILLREELVKGLSNTFPSIEQFSAEEYMKLLNKNLNNWFVLANIAKEEHWLTVKAHRANTLLWYLYVQRVIRNLRAIKIIE